MILKKIILKLAEIKFFDSFINLLLVIKDNFNNFFSSYENVLIIDDSDSRMRYLEKESSKYGINFIWFPRTITNVLFDKYIHVKKQKNFGEWNLETYYEPQLILSRKKLVLRYTGLLKPLLYILKIRLIILPKLNDDWIIDFQKAAKNLGLKILVTDRESSISPKRMEVYPPILKKYSDDLNQVDKLCLNNEMHYEFFIKSGIKKEKLIITGSPQSDFWPNKLGKVEIKTDISKKNILYLGFGVNAYLNFYFKEINDNWESLCRDVHSVINNQLSKYHNKLNIYYKIGSKPARDYWEGYADFYESLKKNKIEDSLIEISGKVSTPSILNSFDAIISFQSSGLVEAMFENIPIISFGWGDLYKNIENSLHDFENTGILFAKSKKELSSYIEDIVQNKELEMDKSKFKETIYKYLYLCDGNSSKRILDEAKHLLK